MCPSNCQGPTMGRQVSVTKEASELGPNAYEVSEESKGGGRRISMLAEIWSCVGWLFDVVWTVMLCHAVSCCESTRSYIKSIAASQGRSWSPRRARASWFKTHPTPSKTCSSARNVTFSLYLQYMFVLYFVHCTFYRSVLGLFDTLKALSFPTDCFGRSLHMLYFAQKCLQFSSFLWFSTLSGKDIFGERCVVRAQEERLHEALPIIQGADLGACAEVIRSQKISEDLRRSQKILETQKSNLGLCD